MNNEGLGQRALQKIEEVGEAYRNSPTAQALVANAPFILQSFKEMNLVGLKYKAELEALAINRKNELDKFKIWAPEKIEECKMLLTNILDLQKLVRELAPQVSSNPDALTVINYTQKQIFQNISLFQNVSLSLING